MEKIENKKEETKKNKKCGIYKITCLKNNKSYIGQSNNILIRWMSHVAEAHKGISSPLYDDYRKYGIEEFDFDIIQFCEPIELNLLEKYYIEKYNTLWPNGYNRKIGGGYPRQIDNNTIEIDGILYPICDKLTRKSD